MKLTESRGMVAWVLVTGAVCLLITGLAPPRPGRAETPSSPVSCVGKLPGDLQAFLQKNFPSWKIVDRSDLREDHRLLWEEKKPTECPGVTVGRFFDINQEAYAILLYELPVHGSREKLIVLRKDRDRVTSRPVGEWKLGPGEAHSEIWVLGPGRYESGDGSTAIRTQLDSIAVELWEGVIMYYWHGGRFRHLVLTV